MRVRNRPAALLTLLWAALAASQALTLTHAEYHGSGSAPGWHRATLSPGETLYPWTRNRVAAWLVLYLAGVVLLVVGRRRDPDGRKLHDLAATTPGLLVAPFTATGLLVLATFLHGSEVVLTGMAAAVAFLALWAAQRTGRALADALARAMLVSAVALIVAVVGEVVLRTPALVARTGGSLEARVALRDGWERRVLSGAIAGVPAWRSRHLGEPKPPGVTRVLVIGDSFSFGDFIDRAEDLWPNVVEDLLNAAGGRVQVINASEAGNDAVADKEVLERLGWSYEPDLVILQYTLNDAGPEMEAPLPLVPLLGTSLRRRSHLYQFLDVRFAALQSALRGGGGWSRAHADGAPGWLAAREALRAVARDASARRVPMMVLLFPMFDSDLREGRYRNLAAHHAVASFLDQMGIPVVDVREALARIDPDPRSWWVRPFDAHPNAAAHRVAAEAIAVELRRRGRIRMRRRPAASVRARPCTR